jgi:hypothetical protein
MRLNMRRNLDGTFTARDLGKGAWRLSRSEPTPIDILLRGADGGAPEVLRAPAVSDIAIEWQPGAVLLEVTSAGRRRSLRTQGAIVHEPLAQLYGTLPLAAFDRKARRFWRTVFRLVRIPGGRYLLAVLARRGRRSA